MTRLVVAALVAASPALADDPAKRPYIFTQGHTGSTQAIDTARMIEVQLPSNSDPSSPLVTWAFRPGDSGGVTPVAVQVVPSPGRIEGFNAVTVFSFAPSHSEDMKITISTDGAAGELIDGVFTLSLTPR